MTVGADGPPVEPADDEILVPGFVDLQVNGVGSVDFWSADDDAWRSAGQALLASGVTSYLPTLVTAPLAGYDAALDRIAAARDDARARDLPRIQGVHLEGPFLGAAPGAHPREHIRAIDVDWLIGVLDRYPGLIRMVTLAPEADPEHAGIRALADRDVVVALGHSRCSYDDAVAAAEAGARLVTHVFNGMGPLHHREPGLVGAALDPCVDLTPTVIADFVHLHPAVVGTVVSTVECILVTDAVATDVEYFGQSVEARDGAAYLPDGTLAGSTLTMDRAVRNVARRAPLEVALEAAAHRPAAALGLDTCTGPGTGGRGDLVALHRETLEVRNVWIGGSHVYGS